MMARANMRGGQKYQRGKRAKGKVKKVGAAQVSNEVKSTLAIEKPSVPVVSRPTYTNVGEKRTISTVSNTKNRKIGQKFGLKNIIDMLCPIFSYKRQGYGNRWDLRHADNPIAGFSDKQGSAVRLQWGPGQQGWAEFCALPMHNWGGNGNGVIPVGSFMFDGFGASVAQLIRKAADIRNDAQAVHAALQASGAAMINPHADTTTALITPQSLLQWSGLTFDYHGGYQSHTFINMSECKINIELWELQPRAVMTNLKTFNSKVRARAVWEDVSFDYKNDLPLGNTRMPQYTLEANQGGNAFQDYKDDINFRITKNSNRTHLKWVVGKSIKVSLNPGDKYIHKVILDPFSFTESTFNNIQTKVENASEDNSGNNNNPVMLVPQFSKMLVVRGWSDLGVRLNGTFTDIAGVGHLSGMLAHTCTEYHKCRMMPYQKPFQTFEESLLSNEAQYMLEHDEDGLQEVDTFGLADIQ